MMNPKKTSGAVTTAALLVIMCFAAPDVKADVTNDTIQIYKNTLIRSYRISMYTDANQKAVFFSVRGEEGKVYQLYLFDIEGKMIRQSEIRNKQTSVIKNIDKGMYLFDVFSDDMRIGNGRIAVK